MTKEVSPEGRAISYEYDSLGRVFKKRGHANLDLAPDTPAAPSNSANDPLLRFTYDLNGNMVKAKMFGDSQNHTYVMAYDGFDRKTRLTEPEGNYTEHTLDAAGNIVRAVNVGKRDDADTGSGALRDVDYHWDEQGRLHRIDSKYYRWIRTSSGLWAIDLEGDGAASEEYAFDARGLTRFLRDDVARVSESVYDNAGREIESHSPIAAPFTIETNFKETIYDAGGNVLREILHEWGFEGTSQVEDLFTTEWEYDVLGRQIRQTAEPDADPTGLPGPQTTLWTYSSLGHELTMLNAEGVGTRRYYDSLGREVASKFGFDSAFDPIAPGLVTGQYVDGFLDTETDYDKDGHVVARRDDSGNETTYTHDAVARQTVVTHADGSKYQQGYDRAGPNRLRGQVGSRTTASTSSSARSTTSTTATSVRRSPPSISKRPTPG